MSRVPQKLTETITIVTGSDHVLGKFIQIKDTRYSNMPQDQQGEGYVLEHDQRFGMGINLANITLEELINKKKETIIEKINIFIDKITKYNEEALLQRE